MLAQFVDVIAAALASVLLWTACYAGVHQDRGARNWLLWGTTAGCVAALVLSVLRRTTAWIDRELTTLTALSLFVIAVGVFGVWLWRRSDTARPSWGRPVAAAVAGLLAFAALPEVFLLTVGLVAPGGSVLSTDVVLRATGYLLGLVVLLVLAWAGHRAAAGATATAARLGVSVMLLIGAGAQVGTVLQILIGRRLIPTPSWLFTSVVWVVNHEIWFGYALALAAVIPVQSARRQHQLAHDISANPAEVRRHRAAGISRRRFLGLGTLGLATVVAATTVGRAVADQKPALSPPEPLESDGQDVWVALDRIDDGHLHRFAYDCADGTEVRFIAIQKNAGVFGVGLDACEICGPTGYFERNGQVICKLCDVAMNINTIGFKGGCNPIPIDYEISDGKLVVARAVLESSAGVFG